MVYRFFPIHLCLSHFISGLEKSVSRELKIAQESVQQQEGGSDCGVFAVMYLIEAMFGTDIRKASYDQGQLRQHIVQCLGDRHWLPFPRAEKPTKVKRVRGRTLHEKVF